ncbi:ABC transporter permease [Paenibacillus sp. 7124]|uniref:ABC transporter permease n=1 Tax=Paenibacillus apii TaxID=1850370 RepID=A0A6M1PPU9_9BACL|nr:ABC transporter permease [Paenibacillus apii]NGM85236.1 ABC transporter permease [Paenibacillus apii]NJJ42106.1 ABC transporter permease [Paenibacillus apii]
MNKYRSLLIHDIRHAGLDPVLMAGFFAPLALLVVSRYIFPIVAVWLMSSFSFDIYKYSSFAAIFLASTIPMLTGMMTGLLMLDERDENVISYYAVTPLMRRGYMLYRLILPSLLCVLLSSIYLLFSGRSEIHFGMIFVIVLLAIEAPCFTLFLAAFAANKVEGLALAKIGGLLIAGPAAAYFVPGAWQLLGAWIPTYWPAEAFYAIEEGNPLIAIADFGVGLIFHLALLYVMVKIFIKRAD